MGNKIKLVLTPNMLGGKNPVGEKVLSTIALIAYVHVILICKAYLEVQIFPLHPALDRFCTKKYFLYSLRHAITLYTRVPNIACRLLFKFARTLILCIEVFSKELPHN